MGRAEGLSTRPYSQYPGPRIANFSDPQQQAFSAVGNLTGANDPTLNQATGLTSQLAQGPGSQYSAGTYNPNLMSNAGIFDTAAAQQYMNPYLNTVLDSQLTRANQRWTEQELNRKSAAARSGVFGGYRQGVQSEMAMRDFNQSVNDIEANALFNAYNNAQMQFERDRAARMGTEQFNIGHALQAFNANQGAQQTAEQLRQGGIGQLLSASNQLYSQGLGTLDAERQRIAALQNIGLQQQQQEQASLDLGYQDFQAQQNWDLNQLNYLNAIMRGIPIQSSTTVSQYENANPYSQLLGLGLNGLALSQIFGGSGAGG